MLALIYNINQFNDGPIFYTRAVINLHKPRCLFFFIFVYFKVAPYVANDNVLTGELLNRKTKLLYTQCTDENYFRSKRHTVTVFLIANFDLTSYNFQPYSTFLRFGIQIVCLRAIFRFSWPCEKILISELETAYYP